MRGRREGKWKESRERGETQYRGRKGVKCKGRKRKAR